MAVLKTILHKKNSSGSYDDVYVRTRADNVLMTDNSTLLSAKISAMDTTIAGKAASGHNHAASNITTGTLGVSRGGTGKSSWTANRLIYPSASTAMTQLAFPSVAGSVLRQGTSGAPYWTSIDDLKSSMGVGSGLTVSLLHEQEYTDTSRYGSLDVDISIPMMNFGYIAQYDITNYVLVNNEDDETGDSSRMNLGFSLSEFNLNSQAVVATYISAGSTKTITNASYSRLIINDASCYLGATNVTFNLIHWDQSSGNYTSLKSASLTFTLKIFGISLS